MEDVELDALLGEMESDRVERKAADSDRDKIRQAICAFANDLPQHQKPGVIFVGVHDDGNCNPGWSVTDERLRTLADMRSDGNILPSLCLCGTTGAFGFAWGRVVRPRRLRRNDD